MIYLPTGCLFFLLLPFFFFLGLFKVISFGFEKLGISPEATTLLLLLMFIGSTINIPLTRRRAVVEKGGFFFKRKEIHSSGISLNLGGAVIPVAISAYLLFQIPVDLAVTAIIFMAIISKFLSKPVPGKGIFMPALVPPLFAVLFAFILSPEYAAPIAFVSGVLGTLIGADLLNLHKIGKTGIISIGGAGVFDGIFLIGIISALFS